MAKGTCPVDEFGTICGRPVLAKGMCVVHYSRVRRHGDPLKGRRSYGNQPCAVEGCVRTAKLKGWCSSHYQRAVRHDGDPLGGRSYSSYPLNLLLHLKPQPDGCVWFDTDQVAATYPQVHDGSGQPRAAHIVMYEFLIGSVPEGKELDHICHDPDICTSWADCLHRRCVWPPHLKPVTHAENSLRSNSPPAVNARKTECSRGHPYNTENTYVHPTTGYRSCRVCRRLRRSRS